jgi:FtsZ-binding cell division protein ZapB
MKLHPYLASAALALATLIVEPSLHAQSNNGVPQQLATLNAQVASLQAAIAALQGQNATLQTTVGNLQTSNAALQNQVAALQSTNTNLQNQINALPTDTNLQNQINGLQTSVTAVQNQLANASHVLALDPYVSVDLAMENGVRAPNIVFSGANVHIVSGSGATNDNGTLTGLGNLIIGYDENPPVSANPQYRKGSHNLIVGRGNEFSAQGFGNLIAGENNYINGECGFVAGANNVIYQLNASICGGQYNSVGGSFNVVVGGAYNAMNQTGDVIVGGYDNGEVGTYSVMLGGQYSVFAPLFGVVQGTITP